MATLFSGVMRPLDAFVTPATSRPDSEPIRFVGEGCRIAGDWSVQALASQGAIADRQAALARASGHTRWDLSHIGRLDTLGAHLLWRAWGRTLPEHIRLSSEHRTLFEQMAADDTPEEMEQPSPDRLGWVVGLGAQMLRAMHHSVALVRMLGQLVIDLGVFLRHPLRGPWREISAQIFRTGAQALGITALVGFLIGIVLSYLSASQLQTFGADRFIVRLLGVSITRELGPLLAAILVAGRSGSAITAQLGVMRVTQELDAMRVMGMSLSQRLILPRVLALALVMPLLVLWTDAMALAGGMLAAQVQLGISPAWFIQSLPEAISIGNYAIGLSKGVAFGITIALVACHFGLLIQPNTDSLGRGTTTSVVTAITAVILVNAIFAISLSGVGL